MHRWCGWCPVQTRDERGFARRARHQPLEELSCAVTKAKRLCRNCFVSVLAEYLAPHLYLIQDINKNTVWVQEWVCASEVLGWLKRLFRYPYKEVKTTNKLFGQPNISQIKECGSVLYKLRWLLWIPTPAWLSDTSSSSITIAIEVQNPRYNREKGKVKCPGDESEGILLSPKCQLSKACREI